ncbi:MAG: 50S ribosomal protein L23 [Patescibacteria group bacterium]|jgi:large subunit ribosomal protein L23
MGIFSSKAPKQKEGVKKSEVKEVKEDVLTPASQQQSSAKAETVSASKGQAGMSYRILHSPRVSEKAAIMASRNIYVINVPVEANKIEIAKAIKDLYGVKVEAVRTARGIGKRLSRGRIKGERNRWKKAFVTVKQGQKIDLYEGV